MRTLLSLLLFALLAASSFAQGPVKETRIVGDTLLPMRQVVDFGYGPIDLSTYTVKFTMKASDGTSTVAATSTGVTAHPTQTFTASATTDYLTANGHRVKYGDQVVVSNSGGALPAGLAASTRYFAVQVGANTLGLSSVYGGALVDLTDAGTGTNSLYVVGSVQYAFSTAAVATAGYYRGWFTLTSGMSVETWPASQYGIPIEVRTLGN